MHPVFDGLIYGVSVGAIMAILLGPVFFILISTSIEKGFPAAVAFAFGVFFSDALIFGLSYISIASTLSDKVVEQVIELAGGVILFILGISLVLKKPKLMQSANIKISSSIQLNLWRGFTLNILNVGAFMYWVAVMTKMPTTVTTSTAGFWGFFGGCLGTILVTDILKAFGASKLQNLVTLQFMLWFNRLSGFIVLFFACEHIYRSSLLYITLHIGPWGQ